MNYQDFYDKMGEFADLMCLGIRNTKKDVFVYVNLFPLNIELGKFPGRPEDCKRLWEFVSVRFTHTNFHEIGYMDRNLDWHFKEFNDNVIPERILDEIKNNYAEVLIAIKSITLQNKLKSINKDFE
ncbi:MAG: hypothetical protein J6T10_27665 [Methanobrevibacter sp.]|nr:hypothetical protein [Methanobrevibacter sp.]